MLTFAFMHHPYLVCVLFGMPSLHPFTFLMFFIKIEFGTLRLDLINAGQQRQQLPSHAFIFADLQVTGCGFRLTRDPFPEP